MEQNQSIETSNRLKKLTISTLSVLLMSLAGCGGGTTTVQEVDKDTQQTTSQAIDENGEENLQTESGVEEEKNLESQSASPSIAVDGKVYYLKTKKEFLNNLLTSTTSYTYDNENYLVKSIKTVDSQEIIKEYKYFNDHQVMKAYDNETLTSISTFRKANSVQDFSFVDVPLSLNQKNSYIANANNALQINGSLQLKTYIDSLEYGGMVNRAKRYLYDSSNLLVKQQDGHYAVSHDTSEQFFVDTNTSFLLEEDLSLLSYEVTQAYNYTYDNAILTGRTYDIYDDGKIEERGDATISYHPNGNIQTAALSSGEKLTYNEEGFLIHTELFDEENNKAYQNYSYSSDYTEVTVKDAGGNTLSKYTFEIKN